MKPKSELILYQTEDNRTLIEVRLENETVWLSLNQLAELFQRDKSVISRHIKNIFEEGELRPESVVANYATTAADAKTYQVEYFNLDVIISVGYRVKSQRGTQFPALTTVRVTRPNHEDAAILPSSPGFRLHRISARQVGATRRRIVNLAGALTKPMRANIVRA